MKISLKVRALRGTETFLRPDILDGLQFVEIHVALTLSGILIVLFSLHR